MITATSGRAASILRRALPPALAAALAALPAVGAPGAGFEIDRWTSEEGLPQSSLRDLVQGPRGYLYISTLDGLARFDGLNFHVFHHVNSPGLESNRLGPLFFSSDSTLWIGTLEAGVARYKNGIFHRYGEREGFTDFLVEGIQEGDGGAIYVNTSRGSAVLRGDRFEAVSDSALGLPPSCHHLAAQDRGLRESARAARLRWFAAADGKALYAIRGGSVTEVPTDIFRLPLARIAMAADRSGRLWCATDRDGVFRLDGSALVRVIAPADLPFPDFDFTGVLQDRSGRIWFCTPRGLYVRSGGTWEQVLSTEGVPSPPLGRILEDREGTIWVAGEGGLAAIRERAIRMIGEPEGLPASNVYCALEDRAGRLWIGTQGGGLLAYEAGRVIPFEPLARTGAQIVTALYEDRDGSLWIGTYDHGVFHYAGGRLELVPSLPKEPARRTIAVRRDRRGDLWFGTLDGLYRARGGKFEVFRTGQGLAGNEVRALCEDRDGALWVGSYGGVTRVAGDDFTRWTGAEGLASPRIRALSCDPDGSLWIGTYDGGLHRLRDGKVAAYKPREGLCPHGAFAILADEAGSLWMSSNQGIYRVKRADLDSVDAGRWSDIPSRLFGLSDGMRSVECNGGRDPSGWKLRDGRLAFATRGGLALVDPKAVPDNPVPPPVVVEAILAGGRPVAVRDPVRLSPGTRSLELKYAGLSYIRPEQVTFRYRLRGLEEEWTQAGTRRNAHYAQLGPGNYVFEVTAANRDGVWNARGAEVAIVIPPHLWEAGWFRGLAGLAAVGLALGIASRRSRAARGRDASRDAFARQLMFALERERKAHGQRPASLEREGLAGAIREMVESAASAWGVTIETELPRLGQEPDAEVATQLYRLVEDYLQYLRRTGVKRAAVSLKPSAHGVSLILADNGPGRGAGREVAAIVERARLLGAGCSVEARERGGTAIRILVGRTNP